MTEALNHLGLILKLRIFMSNNFPPFNNFDELNFLNN